MARRNFGARNNQMNLLLLSLTRMRPAEAHQMGAAWLAVPAEQREELRRAARRQLADASPIVRRSWSNARAFASDAVRNAAYRRGNVHYSDIGDENELPWGAAKAAARDIAGAWAVMPWLEPGLANELMSPGRPPFPFLRAR